MATEADLHVRGTQGQPPVVLPARGGPATITCHTKKKPLAADKSLVRIVERRNQVVKRCLIGVVFLACALASTGCMSGRGMYRHRERPPVDSTALMSKDDVIALTKAQLGDDIIISMINASGSNFRLRTPDVIELADSGVSDKVIGAMLRSGQPTWYPDSSAGGNYYPPYYRYADYPFWGYADYPFWSPWYPPVYLGYWGGFYRPRYGYRISAPLYGSPYRSNGVRSFGGARGGGRRR